MGVIVDERTDLFALGVMVFEMLAGTTPFEGTGVEMMMQNIRAIRRRSRRAPAARSMHSSKRSRAS